MALSTELQSRIEALIAQQRVVLFMKGTRAQPQCGFSASVVETLDALLPEYATVNVLADSDIREGIKVFSDWPTIPQLYVDKELVGGADIVRQMATSGELMRLLGVDAAAVEPPSLTVTRAAAEAIGAADADEPDDVLHLAISPRFEHHLGFGPKEPGELAVESNGVTLYMDLATAKRARGLTVDFVQGPSGSGFKIDNPNAPAAPKLMTVQELRAALAEGAKVYDVRSAEERAIAVIANTRHFDAAAEQEIAGLPKDTRLIFVCHHGGRSQAAASHFAAMGFRDVYNVTGGIDAWAREIDSGVPTY